MHYIILHNEFLGAVYLSFVYWYFQVVQNSSGLKKKRYKNSWDRQAEIRTGFPPVWKSKSLSLQWNACYCTSPALQRNVCYCAFLQHFSEMLVTVHFFSTSAKCLLLYIPSALENYSDAGKVPCFMDHVRPSLHTAVNDLSQAPPS
jgi:hypothetical protein